MSQASVHMLHNELHSEHTQKKQWSFWLTFTKNEWYGQSFIHLLSETSTLVRVQWVKLVIGQAITTRTYTQTPFCRFTFSDYQLFFVVESQHVSVEYINKSRLYKHLDSMAHNYACVISAIFQFLTQNIKQKR